MKVYALKNKDNRYLLKCYKTKEEAEQIAKIFSDSNKPKVVYRNKLLMSLIYTWYPLQNMIRVQLIDDVKSLIMSLKDCAVTLVLFVVMIVLVPVEIFIKYKNI